MNVLPVKEEGILIDASTIIKKTVNHKSCEVFPIKDLDEIQAMKDALLDGSRFQYRNYALFVIGCNLGLRASDLLSLRINEVTDERTFDLKDEITVYEQKTGKYRPLRFNAAVRESILMLLEHHSFKSQYLFESQKGNHIGVSAVCTILKQAAERAEISQNIGTHSMRKTFGFHQLTVHPNDARFLAALQKMFNHRDSLTTLRYIGLTDSETLQYYDDINI